MPVTPELTQRRNSGVAFEVERLGWPTPDRLEVVGRWYGVRGRRFIRPTLNVEVDGEPRRLLAVLDHKPWAVEDGQAWTAAFEWRGEPASLASAELTVGPDIAVELAHAGERPAAERKFARRPRADVLESELERVRQEARRLSRELHEARADHQGAANRRLAEHEAEIEALRAARDAAEQEAERNATALRNELETERHKVVQLETAVRTAREELAVARADLAAKREELERERAALADEASRAAASEVDALRQERDGARRESANARAERDAARRESANARAERDAAFRERDSARRERDTFLAGTRAETKRLAPRPTPATEPIAAPPSASPQATPKPARRTVVRIPAEPDPVEPPAVPTHELDWSAPREPASLPVRLAAVAALLVVVLVLLLVVGLL